MSKHESVLDRFFKIKKIIDSSEKPLTVEEIVLLSDMKTRSVQRYAMRLATEVWWTLDTEKVQVGMSTIG